MDRRPPSLPLWLRPMLPFKRQMIDVGGFAMHVMTAGEGRPILMLHGNPTWGFLYRKIAARLIDEPVQLIMPDLIGLGFSDKPRDPHIHTLEQHAKWLATAIDALDLRDLVFVGQDWGGPIGTLALADHHPDRLAGIVLMNTVVSPPKPGFKSTFFHRFSRMPVISDIVFRGLSFPQINLNMAQGDRAPIRAGVARAYRYPLRYFDDRVAPLALARMVPDSSEHPSIAPLSRVQTYLEAFDGPAALVWGEKDPVLGRLCNRAARILPQATVQRTDGGHFLQEEHPEAIAKAIRRVVADLNR